MPGTVLITGANGSLAQAFIAHLLATEKDLTLIGTVRNTSPSDANTASLRTILSKHPHHNISLEPLDLTSLSSVRRFTHTLSTQIKNGSIPPLSAIICNAFTWSLSGTTKYSPDGFETSFQVTYLSHFLLLMTLLPSMDKTKGRIVLLGSVAHYPERPNPLSRHLSYFPDDLDELVHPPVYPEEEAHDRGWQRYGTAKLMTVVLMNCLNRRLEKVFPFFFFYWFCFSGYYARGGSVW
ncbi:hypothetical protein BDV25DRAFT_150256 [Aspergillus avenaceus]|uniref:3beta-hydroxysteroid 3-dehydrogenase n=1 Tax=Aspergillus avenaceus TaxID=36643 RepID=A0A5N6U2V6_ASPAV|nr:hypothetical protein BDV25DRAFT_150256 [Aspergillus avenaceus]